jgi:hypothetical protein
MFEYGSMSPTLTLHPSASIRREQVSALRDKIRSLEAPRMDTPTHPTLPVVANLFPERGLRRGGVYQLGPQYTLLWTLIAQMTRSGHFVGLVGFKHLGLRSAEDLGVDLDHLVIIKDPGNMWWHTTNTLIDALSLVALRPSGTLPSAHQRDRFQARLRERGSTLLVAGAWPGADAAITVEHSRWDGLEAGAGLLQRQELTLSYRGRRDSASRSLQLVVSADGINVAPRHDDASTITPLPMRRVADSAQERQAG